MKKALLSFSLLFTSFIVFSSQIFAAPGDPLPPQSMSPTPSPTPTITPTTTVGPIIRVANLDSTLDVRTNAPNDGTNLYPDVRIEVGDADGANSNYQYVSVLNSFESVVLSKFYANFAGGVNLDWSKLVNDFDKTRGAIYFNSTDNLGLSSIPGVYDIPKMFLKNTATHNISKIGDYSNKEDIWGNTISVDNQNNIGVVVERAIESSHYETWLYIWNDPVQFSRSNADHVVNIGVNYPGPAYSNAYGTVESVGDGLFLVAWFTQNNTDSTKVLHYKIINADGGVVLNDVDLINGRFLYQPSRDSLKVSKLNGEQLMFIWKDGFTNGDVTRTNSGIGQIISLDGNLVGDWFYINPPEHNVSDPDVDALSDGRYVIVYYDGNNEDVYYRIYDPTVSAFSGDPVLIDDFSVYDYAGYLQDVSADDKGGFGVVWGGYYNDGVDAFDRVYFQIFDENENPLYSTDTDVLVSDDNLTNWYWDSLGIEYYNNEYQIVWDTRVSDTDFSGIAYRKISSTGVKSNATLVEKSQKYSTSYPPAMDINRDGVPIIIWKQSSWYTDQIPRGIFGMYGPVPSENAGRLGFCPNATSLNEVKKDCTNLTYMSPGDPGVSWSTDDDVNNLAHESYVLTGFDKGGAFVDGVPAFAFRDFGQGQSTYDNLEVKWYDTGLSGDGDINFYYDIDNVGFDGTAINGTFLESGAANSAILDLSSLPAGEYYLYAVVDDGFYTPFRIYSPQTITKTELVTPTPSVSVTVTVTPSLTSTPTDTPINTPTDTPLITPTLEPTNVNIPQKVKISDIGLISNVVEKDFVGYYFTSQSPVIKGIAEALNTIHFTYGGKDYTTTSGADGKFTITINNPILPRTAVDLIYFSTNQSGVNSPTRVLRLIIGSENFPSWLVEDLNLGQTESGQEAIVSITNTPSTIPTKSNEKPSGFSNEVEVLLKDLNGKVLINSDILFDGQAMKTDVEGKIKFNELSIGEHKIEFNGETKSISVVKGQNNFVVYYINSVIEDTRPSVSPIYYILIILAVITTIIIAYKIYKKR